MKSISPGWSTQCYRPCDSTDHVAVQTLWQYRPRGRVHNPTWCQKNAGMKSISPGWSTQCWHLASANLTRTSVVLLITVRIEPRGCLADFGEATASGYEVAPPHPLLLHFWQEEITKSNMSFFSFRNKYTVLYTVFLHYISEYIRKKNNVYCRVVFLKYVGIDVRLTLFFTRSEGTRNLSVCTVPPPGGDNTN